LNEAYRFLEVRELAANCLTPAWFEHRAGVFSWQEELAVFPAESGR
jgi:hypothetical protein